MVAQRTCTVGVAFFRIDQYQVDVGRSVEFGAAEFAHADDMQLLRCVVGGAARFAVHGGEIGV